MNKPDNSDGSRGQLTARTDTCIHVRIPGHTGRIPGSYLHDKSRHSSFVAITQLENPMSQSRLTDGVSKNFKLY
jgi:hypothetical protein